VNGVIQRFNLRQSMSENRIKPAGEWNTYEMRAAGRQITLWVNGAVTCEFKECEAPRGYIGSKRKATGWNTATCRLGRCRSPYHSRHHAQTHARQCLLIRVLSCFAILASR